MTSDTKTRKRKWRLRPPSSKFEKHFEKHREHTKYISEYETNVTDNPFYHPAKNRITKIRKPKPHYPKGSHRWKKSDLRIIYLPDKEDHTIYTLDAGTASSIPYKKK